jgi:hypothetical protein
MSPYVSRIRRRRPDAGNGHANDDPSMSNGTPAGDNGRTHSHRVRVRSKLPVRAMAAVPRTDYQPKGGKVLGALTFRASRPRTESDGCNRDLPVSDGTLPDEKVRTSADQGDSQAKATIRTSRELDKPSSQLAASSTPSVRGKNLSLRELLALLPAAHFELFEAVASPFVRQVLRQIRATLVAPKQREIEDGDLLLRIFMCRKQRPGVSLECAIREVVASLPSEGPLRSGDMRVWLSARPMSEASAMRTLRRKFRKHADEIARWANGVEAGKALAQRYVPPVLDQVRHVSVQYPMGTTPLNLRAPAAVDQALRFLDNVTLTAAAEAFFHETSRLIRSSRCG